MPATELTTTLKRDLTLLQMRDVLDPKRHYRASAKTLPKYFQVPFPNNNGVDVDGYNCRVSYRVFQCENQEERSQGDNCAGIIG